MCAFIPTTIYLAETTAQIIAVYACLVERGDEGAVIFVDRSHIHGDGGLDPLLDAGRSRFLQARIVEYSPAPHSSIPTKHCAILAFFCNWAATQKTKKAMIEALCSQLKLSESSIKSSVKAVNFTYTHYYVLCFLAIFPHSVFIVYPHGFSEPRAQGVAKWPYLYRRRSILTALCTLPSQLREFGIGTMLRGFLGCLVRHQSLLLPFPGVDEVITFRPVTDDIVGRLSSRITTLEETFRWLLGLSFWIEAVDEIQRKSTGSLIVLLPECNRHPIWERNVMFGPAHATLIKSLLHQFPGANVVLKQHVRSDGTAARWLRQYLAEELPSVEVSILSPSLSRIPIEAIALFGSYSAAGSIGSVSLPLDLGLGITHYFSKRAASLFDTGWREPFWVNYENECGFLASDGIGLICDNG